MSPAVNRRDSAMSIGEVIALLSPDFPDVSISKIRLWESEGLVEPARTPSGYRKFSHQDVERLRYAMTLQRDRFWPLRKIRDHLDAVSRGAEELVNGASGPRCRTGRPRAGEPPTPASTPLRGDGPVRLSAAELCARARIDPEELDALVGLRAAAAQRFGLVRRQRAGHRQRRRRAGRVRHRGPPPAGVPHRGRPRGRAGRAGGQPVARRPGATSRARADDTAQEITAVALRLHAALVRAGLVRAGLG